MAFNCESWEGYNSGNCNYDCTYEKCQTMAFGLQYSENDFRVNVPDKAMKLYIETTAKEPFCSKSLISYLQNLKF